MRRSPSIRALAPQPLKGLKQVHYDAALASLGFETRSRQIPVAIGTPATAHVIPFGDRHVLDYAKNERWFATHDWEQVKVPERQIAPWTASWLTGLSTGRSEPVRIAVDVSSMSRLRIAAVIEAILLLPADARAQVDLLYTPASFKKPPNGEGPQVFDIAPVSNHFAGWWTDLEAPLAIVIGLGYELEMAASAIDKLEPQNTIVFVPDGEDSRYRGEVDAANHALLAGATSQSVLYQVADPFGCFSLLESALSRLERGFRVAFVPLGPKIFAACAMVAAGLHPESAQVVRVTAGARGPAINRTSNGKVCGLTVLVSPPPNEPGDPTDAQNR